MSAENVTLFGTLLVIFSTCFLSTEGLEGRLFYISFMNISTNGGRYRDARACMQEIFIASSDSGRVKIQYNSPLNYTEDIIELNSENNFQYVKRIMRKDLGAPLNTQLKLAIVVSSEVDISIQANKAVRSTGDGYLALPITEESVSFFLASYSPLSSSLPTTLSIASPFNDTRVSISYVRGNSSDSLLNLTMQANDVYQAGSHDIDYTGIYVASSQPIAVYSGHACANVPVGISFCDHIVEQVPPVGQWGTSFIMASFYGRPWAVGYWIRVIAQIDTNVTYTYQSFDANNNPSTWSIFRRATLDRGEWDEASLESISATNAIVVMVNCTFDCLVMQYNPGFTVLSSSGPGEIAKPDPFMVTVPPLNHYPQNVHFSTSRHYDGTSDYECVNGVTIVAKTADVNRSKIYLDEISLTSIGGTMFVITADGYSDYSVIIAPLTAGFHSVTSIDPNAYYAVFVYGHGTHGWTSYGYLGGYRYLPMTSGSTTNPSSSSTSPSSSSTHPSSSSTNPSSSSTHPSSSSTNPSSSSTHPSSSSTNPSSSSTYDPSSTTEWTTEESNTACPVIELGIGLGASLFFIIIVLLSVILYLCIENRSLRQYKKESQSQELTQSQNGRTNHAATGSAAVLSSSSSTLYNTDSL